MRVGQIVRYVVEGSLLEDAKGIVVKVDEVDPDSFMVRFEGDDTPEHCTTDEVEIVTDDWDEDDPYEQHLRLQRVANFQNGLIIGAVLGGAAALAAVVVGRASR